MAVLNEGARSEDNDVPFHVALPYTTLDAGTATGADVPIEERCADEVTHVAGEGGSIRVHARSGPNYVMPFGPFGAKWHYVTRSIIIIYQYID